MYRLEEMEFDQKKTAKRSNIDQERHRIADKKWRASVSSSFSILEMAVTPERVSGATDRKTRGKEPRQTVLDSVVKFINEKEEKIASLVKLKKARTETSIDGSDGQGLELYKKVFNYLEDSQTKEGKAGAEAEAGGGENQTVTEQNQAPEDDYIKYLVNNIKNNPPKSFTLTRPMKCRRKLEDEFGLNDQPNEDWSKQVENSLVMVNNDNLNDFLTGNFSPEKIVRCDKLWFEPSSSVRDD